MNSKILSILIGMGSITLVSGLLAVSALRETWRAQDSLKESQKIIERLQENMKANDEVMNRMIHTNLRISEDLYLTKFELDKMKGRSETVLKKPELVEKMIQDSFSDFSKEMSCVTGMQSFCQ